MAGQPESVPYFATSRPKEVLDGGGRLDGRAHEEFRRVFLRTGVISQAAGSGYAEFGRTKVMVGVYGPRQSERREAYSEMGRVACDVKLATFATRQRGRVHQSPEEREMSAIMQTALEGAVALHTFPKAVLDVYCTILEAGGSETAVAITAAALAIADAGVEMTDVVTACCTSKVQGSLLLDPSADEAFREDSGLLLAVTGGSGEVTQVAAHGRWQGDELREGLELCLGGCSQLEAAARQCLKEAAQARLQAAAPSVAAAVGGGGH